LTADLAKIDKEFQWLAEIYPQERKRRFEERVTFYLEFFDLPAE
jgi:hypothetical protein